MGYVAGASLFIGLTLLVAGVLKGISLRHSALVIQQLLPGGIGSRFPIVATATAVVVVPLEIVLGVGLVFTDAAVFGLGAAALFVMFAGVVALAVKKKTPCGCFGALSRKQASKAELGRTIVLTTIAMYVAYGRAAWSPADVPIADAAAVAGVLFAVVAAVTIGLQRLSPQPVIEDEEPDQPTTEVEEAITPARRTFLKELVAFTATAVGAGVGLGGVARAAGSTVGGSLGLPSLGGGNFIVGTLPGGRSRNFTGTEEFDVGGVLHVAEYKWTNRLSKLDIVIREAGKRPILFRATALALPGDRYSVRLASGTGVIDDIVDAATLRADCPECQTAGVVKMQIDQACATAPPFGWVKVGCTIGKVGGTIVKQVICLRDCDAEPVPELPNTFQQECLAACTASCGGSGTCKCCSKDDPCSLPLNSNPIVVGNCRCGCLN